jgi:molecular chaperone DnaK
MKETAEAYLGEPVSQITVPAYFSDSQRQRPKDAGRIAGLKLRIINEPTAARSPAAWTKAHRHDRLFTRRRRSTSVLRSATACSVKSTNGDTFLGGEDFDARIVDYLADGFPENRASTCAAKASCGSKETPRRRRSSCPRPKRPDQPAVHHRRRRRAEAW